MDRLNCGPDIRSIEFEQQFLAKVCSRLDACIAEELKWANHSGYGGRNHEDDEVDFHTSERVKIANRNLQNHKRLRQSLYHARFDFQWQLEDHCELVYIGLSRLDDRSGDILIHDWRTPICQLHSQSKKVGPAEIVGTGRNRGTILLRREYQVDDERIRILSSTDEFNCAWFSAAAVEISAGSSQSATATHQNAKSESSALSDDADVPNLAVVRARNERFGEGRVQTESLEHGNKRLKADVINTRSDEMLTQILSENTSGAMNQIVRTIQTEQDVVIRANAPVVAVQGPAGSGKSVIALHRAAYMLYHMRMAANDPEDLSGRFSGSRVMVFSPNKTFQSYIVGVLPSLMEDSVQSTVLHDMVPDRLERALRNKSSYKIERLSQLYEAGQNGPHQNAGDVRLKGVQFKSSRDIYQCLVAFLDAIKTQIAKMVSHDVVHVIAPEERQFRARERIDRQVLLSGDVLVTAFERGVEKPLIQRIDAVLACEREVINRIRESPDVLAAVTKQVSEARLRQLFADTRKSLRKIRNMSVIRWYILFLNYLETGKLGGPFANESTPRGSESRSRRTRKSTPAGGAETGEMSDWIRPTIRSINKRIVMNEDVVPIMCLHGMVAGFPTMNGVIHAVVDEAQDYSMLQFQYLRRLLPATCSITIVGDPYQSIIPHAQTTDFNDLTTVFPDCSVMEPLEFSYRSSKEITDFASSLLLPAPVIKNIRSTGVLPELIDVPASTSGAVIAKLVERLNDEGFRSVGVVCKSSAEAAALYTSISGCVSISLLSDGKIEFQAGNYVTSLLYAKGLEFDAVIIADASDRTYWSDDDRRPLYTACTRALHRLYLCYENEMSKLIPPVDSELYTFKRLADVVNAS